MATYTEHYNLKKPALNDAVNINDINSNSDIIDTVLHNKVDDDDLTATRVMMSDGVTSVESRIDAHDLTNRVSISSYTSSNKYTCPSDGYIFVYNTSSVTGYISIDDLASIGAATGRFSTFVRKGTQVWIEGTVTSAYFSSLQ